MLEVRGEDSRCIVGSVHGGMKGLCGRIGGRDGTECDEKRKRSQLARLPSIHRMLW